MATQLPIQGGGRLPRQPLENCAAEVAAGKDATVKLCDATNPPTAGTTQKLAGKLPSKLAAAAKKKKKKKKKKS